MVDALASGASVRKDVEVRVLSWAPFIRFLSSCEIRLLPEGLTLRCRAGAVDARLRVACWTIPPALQQKSGVAERVTVNGSLARPASQLSQT